MAKKKIKKVEKKKVAKKATAPVKAEPSKEYSNLEMKKMALAVAEQEAALAIRELTPSRIDLLRKTVAKDATPEEFSMFMTYAVRSGLDPFAHQIYFVKRRDNRTGEDRATIQTGIDGLRSTAEKTGAYAGSDDPIIEGKTEQGYPEKIKIVVYKMVQGTRVPFTGTAKWVEFYPGEKLGFMWRKMPETMLAKCAEAQALRKAFPMVMGGFYVHEEMQQADRGKKATVTEEKAMTPDDKYKLSLDKINECESGPTLLQWREKILKSREGTAEQREHLISVIDEKVERFKANTTPSSTS